ncbi:hypothetical protein [Streptomyces hydrogenans]
MKLLTSCGEFMPFKSKWPYNPWATVPYRHATKDCIAVLAASALLGALVGAIGSGFGWPGWVPWLVPIAGLCWGLKRHVDDFNELARCWNTKIDSPERGMDDDWEEWNEKRRM